MTAQCPIETGQPLRLPFATTWRQPGSNQLCSGIGNGTTTNDVFPGSPSKCNKGILTLDIFSEPVRITVIKDAQIGFPCIETGGECDLSGEGEERSVVLPLTLTSLVDTPFGDITQSRWGCEGDNLRAGQHGCDV